METQAEPWTKRKPDAELVETHIEERDGTAWLSGKCSNCLARVVIPAPPAGATGRAQCPEGHVVRFGAQRSDQAAPGPLPHAEEPSRADDAQRRARQGFVGSHPAEAPRRSAQSAEPQPMASTWDSNAPYNGPPSDGHPRGTD
jgi:hypothetical protein